MNCPNCGAEILVEEAAFCGECGAKLGGGGAPLEPTLLEDDAPTASGTGGDTLLAEQDRAAPRSASPSASESPIDTRKVSPPAEHVPPAGPPPLVSAPPAPCAADKPGASAPDVGPARIAGAPCGASCPVRLEFNVAKVYVEGMKGVVEFRVVNALARSLKKVKVTLKHDYVIQKHRTRVANQVAPGDENRTLRTQLDLPPDSGGEVLIDFEVRVEDPEAPGVYCNSHSIFVLPPSAPAQQVVMNLTSAPTVEASEKGMMGAYVDAKTNINAVIEGHDVETAADLWSKSKDIAPAWHPVRLYVDDEMTDELKRMLARPRGPGGKTVSGRAPAGQAATRLRLDVEVPSGAMRLVVLSKREVTFGKSRRGADICTVVLPLSRENTKLSRQISGRFDRDTGERTSHMELKLASSGLEVLDHSRNGTFVDGKMVGKGAPAALGREAKLSLAEVLDLGVRVLAPGDDFDPADYTSLVRGGLFEDALSSRVAAASIERVDNFPDESYLVLFSGAALGSSRDASVPLAGAGLAPKHLLLVHLGDGFYVENISGRAEGTRLNGSPLDAGTLAPIWPGDRIEAGDAEIRVGDFEQLRPEA